MYCVVSIHLNSSDITYQSLHGGRGCCHVFGSYRALSWFSIPCRRHLHPSCRLVLHLPRSCFFLQTLYFLHDFQSDTALFHVFGPNTKLFDQFDALFDSSCSAVANGDEREVSGVTRNDTSLSWEGTPSGWEGQSRDVLLSDESFLDGSLGKEAALFVPCELVLGTDWESTSHTSSRTMSSREIESLCSGSSGFSGSMKFREYFLS